MESKTKKFCSVHSYIYSGVECPFCLQERIKKFDDNGVKQNKKSVSNNGEVTEEMLEKLVNKFKK